MVVEWARGRVVVVCWVRAKIIDGCSSDSIWIWVVEIRIGGVRIG